MIKVKMGIMVEKRDDAGNLIGIYEDMQELELPEDVVEEIKAGGEVSVNHSG